MKFEEALVELRKGKKIKRICFYESLSLDIIKKEETLKIMISDILQDDWIIEEKPGKTFPEVFEAFKKGKSIRRKSWVVITERVLTKGCEGNIINSFDLEANDWEIIE